MSVKIAAGVDGGNVLRRAYRRSPLLHLRRITLSHRGLRPNDVFVASYPRSGSAWTRFLLVELLVGEASFERVLSTVRYVGKHSPGQGPLPGGARLIKTHERYVSHYRRAIHVVRDPRDVVSSSYHHQQRTGGIVVRSDDDLAESFDRFVSAFVAGRVDPFGTWQTHLVSWLRASREGADVLRIRYEDLHADTAAQVRKMADWLNVPTTDEIAARVVERCSFERMRASERQTLQDNPDLFGHSPMRDVVPVVRQGRAGGWRQELTDAQQQRFAAFAEGLDAMGYSPA